jgi:predicted flap endonuclease-1-like 5' DNA nuclease
MRLDFALYGLAVVLFALSAIVLLMVAEVDGRSVYVVSTAVLGLLTTATGYLIRPKPQSPAPVEPVISPSPPVQVEPVQQAPVEVPVVEAAEPETPEPAAVVVSAPAETTVSIEAPKMLEPAATVETPVLTAPQPAPQLSAPSEVPALAPAVVPIVAFELTQIRGISATRAQQLKDNGINTVSDLAKASPEEVAAKLAVSPKIVKMWIGSAKKQIK